MIETLAKHTSELLSELAKPDSKPDRYDIQEFKAHAKACEVMLIFKSHTPFPKGI